MKFEEGEECPYCDYGKMIYPPVENCSCHINPPCNACVDNRLECDDCGFREDDKITEEYRNPRIVHVNGIKK